MTKIFDCYVERPTKEEAIEIVERLIANGAKVFDVVEGMDIPSCGYEYDYEHNEYDCWGYCSEHGTYTGALSIDWPPQAKQLTMQEFRAAFPCDKYDGVGEEWPQSGDKVVVDCYGTWEAVFIGISPSGVYVCEMPEGYPYGVYDSFAKGLLRKPKTDREKFVESALEVVKAHQWTTEELLEALYDAGFKAPELC